MSSQFSFSMRLMTIVILLMHLTVFTACARENSAGKDHSQPDKQANSSEPSGMDKTHAALPANAKDARKELRKLDRQKKRFLESYKKSKEGIHKYNKLTEAKDGLQKFLDSQARQLPGGHGLLSQISQVEGEIAALRKSEAGGTRSQTLDQKNKTLVQLRMQRKTLVDRAMRSKKVTQQVDSYRADIVKAQQDLNSFLRKAGRSDIVDRENALRKHIKSLKN